MNQKRQNISTEMLSAYLDNQLSEKDSGKVESALLIDAALKHELEMLDATRRLLRNAPTIKVPRNFTLTPTMVTKTNPFKFWMPAMSFSSAMAAILLVLSYIFNFNPVSTSMATQSRSMDMLTASDSVAMEMADQSVKGTVEETPMIIQWNNPQAGGMGGGGGPAAAVAEGEVIVEEAAPMAAEMPAPEMNAGADTAFLATTEETYAEEMAAAEPSVAMDQELPVAKDVPDTNSDFSEEAASNLILGVSPEEERGQIIDEQSPAIPQLEPVEAPVKNQLAALSIFRGGLLLLSITFAIIAYLMHRHQS
jgi:hypothetical protein